jgi:glycosyltransferase involved in cell wall biosynthesis
MMLTVNYITRPWFLDVAVEFINEFKHQVNLNVILIIAPQTASYLGINQTDAAKYLNRTLKIEDVLHCENRERFYPYFKGANVFCKFEQHKETSLHNALSWHKLLKENKNLAFADFNVIESLSLADWYFLIRFRNKSLYYIMHDPVPHTGEERGRTAKINNFYFPYIKGFITYSKFAANLFKNYYPKYASKLFTFSLPIYTSVNVKPHQTIGKKMNKVVFFGRISPYKGVQLFYDAAASLISKFPNTQFFIAGKSTDDYQPDFLSKNSHANIIILNQFIDLDQLYAIMSDAQFCVLPYTDATQSGVIMTSYAFNLPVLVSNCEGLLEYCFDKENFSFLNGNVDDLAKKIENLLTNQILVQNYELEIKSFKLQNINKQNVNILLSDFNHL